MALAIAILALARNLGMTFAQTVVWSVLAVTALLLAFLAGIHAMIGLDRERVLRIHKGERWDQHRER